MDSEGTGASSLAGPLLACAALAAALVLIFSSLRSLTTKSGATGGKEVVKHSSGTATKKAQQSKPSDPPPKAQQQAEVLAKAEAPAAKAKKRKKKRPKDEDEEEPEAEQAAPGPEVERRKEAAAVNVTEKPRKTEAPNNPVVADVGTGWTEVHKKKGSAEADEQAQRRADRNRALRCRRAQLSERIRRLEEGLRAGGARRQDEERRSLEERAKLLEDLSRVNLSLQRLAEEGGGGGEAAVEAEAEEAAVQEEADGEWGDRGGGEAWWAWDAGHHAGPGAGWSGGGAWDDAGAWEETGDWEERCDEQAGGWWEEGRFEEQAGGWRAAGRGAGPERGGWQGRRGGAEQGGAAHWAVGAWPRSRRWDGGQRPGAGESWQREEEGGGATSSWRGGRYRTARGENAGWEPSWEAGGAGEPRPGGEPRRKGGRKGGGERRDRVVWSAAAPATGGEGETEEAEAAEPQMSRGRKGRGRGEGRGKGGGGGGGKSRGASGGRYRPFVANIGAIAAGHDSQGEEQGEEPEATAQEDSALGRREEVPEGEEEEAGGELSLEELRAKGRAAAALLGARPGQRASWGDAESSDDEQDAATDAMRGAGFAAREAARAGRTEAPSMFAAPPMEATPAESPVWDEDLVAFLGEDALNDEEKFQERLRGVPQWVAEKALRTRERLHQAEGK